MMTEEVVFATIKIMKKNKPMKMNQILTGQYNDEQGT